MPCFSPLKGWRSSERTKLGKRKIVFVPRDALLDMPVAVPCGQCVGCRLERSRQWAVRCLHESSLYERNCFITLTYSDENLPSDLSLNVREFQLFMKRLRNRFGDGIRFFHCGEYGENFGRPHYHACLFNFEPTDKVLWSIRDNVRLYTSESLSEVWGKGFVTVGDVTFESAAYVARYVMKKITGKNAPDHYTSVNPLTGQAVTRAPEYTTMSRRPGIGKGWYDKFFDDIYPSDFVVVNGVKCRVPRFYDKQFEHDLSSSDFTALKGSRVIAARNHAEDNTERRLLVRDKLAKIKGELLIRNLK